MVDPLREALQSLEISHWSTDSPATDALCRQLPEYLNRGHARASIATVLGLPSSIEEGQTICISLVGNPYTVGEDEEENVDTLLIPVTLDVERDPLRSDQEPFKMVRLECFLKKNTEYPTQPSDAWTLFNVSFAPSDVGSREPGAGEEEAGFEESEADTEAAEGAEGVKEELG